jgi:hypothetical protein
VFFSSFGQMTWIHWKEEQTTTRGAPQHTQTKTQLMKTLWGLSKHHLSNKSANLYKNNMMSTPSPWQCLHYIRVASKWVITIGKCVHKSLCALLTHIEHDYIPKICEGCNFPPLSYKWASLFVINSSTFITFQAFITTTTVFPNWHK